MRSADERSAYFDGQPRSERDDGDVAADSPGVQFLWFVFSKPHQTGPMRVEILRLRAELSVRAREQQIV